jgi:outer membrane beta-barrel protein
MNTASRFLTRMGLILAAAGVLLDAPRAEAQEVQVTGPLAGAPAVRHMRIYRDGRFQLQPSFGMTINDDFAQTMMAGLQAGYHFTDWLGLTAFFNYGVYSRDTGLTQQIEKHGQTTEHNVLSLPSAGGFPDQIGRINYLSGVQATFIPLRGKLSLFQALFVDTDFYLFAGAAFAGIEERTNTAYAKDATGATVGCAPSPVLGSGTSFQSVHDSCLATQGQRSSRTAIAPTFGAGISMYFTDYLALTLEYRAFPFKWNTSGTDESGWNAHRQNDSSGGFPDGRIDESDRLFHFNQMFTLGLAFYLPWQNEVTE